MKPTADFAKLKVGQVVFVADSKKTTDGMKGVIRSVEFGFSSFVYFVQLENGITSPFTFSKLVKA